MADIVLFHHAQGLTQGVQAFADRLRRAGHLVIVPDFYEGLTFPTVDALPAGQRRGRYAALARPARSRH